MKIKDYLKALPKGEVVNKTALAYFKRLGYIWDYSRWGYLESLHIWGKKPTNDIYHDEFWLEISPKKNCAVAEKFEGAMYGKNRQTGCANTEKTFDEMLDIFGSQGSFEFEGMTFRTRYFDGCFKPYLVKDTPNDKRECVHHTIAMPSGVY